MKKNSRFHSLFLIAIGGTLLTLLAFWTIPETLYANGNCGTYGPYHVGTGSDHVVAVTGVSVNLNSREPLLCQGSANWSASAVWTNIGSITNCGWSQAGYFKTPGLSIKVYGEYNKNACYFPNSGYMRVVWGTGQAGVHTYQVNYNAKKQKANLWYDSNVITGTPFDPGVEWGAQPWDREWNGETHDRGDDMPGSAASPVFFTNLLYKNCQGCAWVDPGLRATLNTLPERYGLQQDAGSSFHIWTK